jgi:ribosomal protein L29
MKLKDIAGKTDKELQDLITDQQKKLAEVVVEMRTKQVTNVKQIHGIKKTIARALTIQSEREITKLEQTND